MATQPKNMITVGGSLAGLMTSLALKHLGGHIRIFERSPTSLQQDQGAGIVFGTHAQEFFHKHVHAELECEKTVASEVERMYAGYVAWRGTVLESAASELLKRTFVDCFTFFHGPGIQILLYLIPGEKGSLEPGKRFINWVWNCNYPANSQEYKDLMTNSDGHFHHTTMPAGKMQDRIWTQQKGYAKNVLPTAFSELVYNTKHPFVQAITDVLSPRASFFNNKLLLVGDAVAGFRPHTAASTSQAAYHALLLEKHMIGEMNFEDMLGEMMDYAKHLSSAAGQKMGNRSQFGDTEMNLKEIASSGRIKVDD